MINTAKPRVQSTKGSRLDPLPGAITRAAATPAPCCAVAALLPLSKHLQRSFDLAARMQVSGTRGRLDALAVERSRLVHAAELGQRLAAVVISRGIIGVDCQKPPVFVDRLFQVAGPRPFHGQSITGETVARVLRDKVFEQVQASFGHVLYFIV